MQKIFLPVILFCLLTIMFATTFVNAQGIVPNPTGPNGTYSITDFFTMLGNIYKFIVTVIAAPLAIIAIIIGAILMMSGAANPALFNKGKTILITAIIGLVLVYCSYLIIDFILHAIGYTGNWSSI